MTPEIAYTLIRDAIRERPDLRYKGAVPASDPFPGNPYRGFCYVATEVFCHLVPEAKPWCMDNGMHYWAMIGDERWDLTAEQFDGGTERLDAIYSTGRPTRFKQFSARARELYDETLAA